MKRALISFAAFLFLAPPVFGQIAGKINLPMQSSGTLPRANGSQCDVYVAPGTNVIQGAIDALPDTGGVICLGAGTYIQTGTAITIGNGTTSMLSIRHGVIISGVTLDSSTAISAYSTDSATVIDCTGTTDGTCIRVNGPLEGWGLKNLQLSGSSRGSQSYGVSVISAKFGSVRNLFINGFKIGINSTTQTSFSGGTNYDSFGNVWENIKIKLPSGGTQYGLVLGTAATNANTDFNHFKNIFVWPGASGTNACMQMGWTDGNIFNNFVCVSNAKIYLDYTGVAAGRVPNNNYWYGLELGGSSMENIGGTPGNTAHNYVFGFSETNGSRCPNIANLEVYGCSTGYVQDQVVKGLTASTPTFTDGNKKLISGSVQGNTTKVVTYGGSTPSTDDCAKYDTNGNATTLGAACLTSSTAVTSVAKSGSTALHGAVTFSEGVNVTLTQSGNNIAIASSGRGSGTTRITRLYPGSDITPTLDGAFHAIAFAAETVDDGGWHDNSTNNTRITFGSPQTCTIIGNAVAGVDTVNGAQGYIEIYKNGSGHSGGTRLAVGGPPPITGTLQPALVFMTATTQAKFTTSDYIELYYSMNASFSNATLYGAADGNTFLSVICQ